MNLLSSYFLKFFEIGNVARHMYKSYNHKIKWPTWFLDSLLKYKLKASEIHAAKQIPPSVLIPFTAKL